MRPMSHVKSMFMYSEMCVPINLANLLKTGVLHVNLCLFPFLYFSIALKIL